MPEVIYEHEFEVKGKKFRVTKEVGYSGDYYYYTEASFLKWGGERNWSRTGTFKTDYQAVFNLGCEVTAARFSAAGYGHANNL